MTAIIVPTTLGTIKATTLGNFIFQIAQWGLAQQKISAKNPNGFDNMSLTINSEIAYDNLPTANGGSATIDVNFPVKWLSIPITTKAIVIPDYLTSSGYLPGTGGTPTFDSSSWCQSLTEAILILHLLQGIAAKNPSNIKPVSNWSLTSQNDTGINNNGLFAATLELPLIQTFDNTTGNLILSGASPLGDLI
jgi:hypothetical protein